MENSNFPEPMTAEGLEPLREEISQGIFVRWENEDHSRFEISTIVERSQRGGCEPLCRGSCKKSIQSIKSSVALRARHVPGPFSDLVGQMGIQKDTNTYNWFRFKHIVFFEIFRA